MKSQAMAAPDVVRWTRECPWWDKKPGPEGSALVPAGSPGVCRIVMIAPRATVTIMQGLRDVALCVVLDDTSQVCFVVCLQGAREGDGGERSGGWRGEGSCSG